MEASVTMAAAGCSFTFSAWSRRMGSIPETGTLVGDQVTLGSSTDDDWASCKGTGDPTMRMVADVCADDGADWSMAM
jgi:hypothetical protein